MKIRARAPSNIALVKYMGKSDSSQNLPLNSSFSMTLQDFHSTSDAETLSAKEGWNWTGGESLSSEEIKRVISHLERVESETRVFFKKEGIEITDSKGFGINCENSFPARAGIASSASSFAALTLAAIGALDVSGKFRRNYFSRPDYVVFASSLSRKGSGSSVRSFLGPFVKWETDGIQEIELPKISLVDFVLVVEGGPKEIPSSRAHSFALSSPLFEGRVARAEKRCEVLIEALKTGDLRVAAQESLREMWEMHSLFHTSSSPFTYFKPETLEVLEFVTSEAESADSPIFTLDAGPNPHILVEARKAKSWKMKLKERFPRLELLESGPGKGAQWLE